MPVVEPSVSEEKLRQLLEEGHESPQLDHKARLDLRQKRDKVELAKDVGAMSFEGGYIVVGVDDHGIPTGELSPADVPLFDEARLRGMLGTWIQEPFALLSACHVIEGKTVAVIYVGPRRDYVTVFSADGQYEDPPGRSRAVFRQGDVFVRHGTASERWNQHDVARLREQVRESERESWARELAPLIEQISGGQRAVDLVAGSSRAYTWQLDAESFENMTIELLRRDDTVPIRLLLRRVVGEARTLLDKDPSEFRVLLDRLACLATQSLLLERRSDFERTIATFRRIYDLIDQSPLYPDENHARVWLDIITRAVAIGGVAVREQDWDAVRTIAMQRGSSQNERYNNWIRHGLTMAARAGLFREDADGKAVELSLLQLAKRVADSLDCLRSDAPSDDDLLDSLCQFDILAILCAIKGAGRVSDGNWYTSFARFNSRRTEPAIDSLLTDTVMRAAIFPSSDQLLADALRAIDRMANREAWRFAGWDGFTSPTILRFLDLHPPS